MKTERQQDQDVAERLRRENLERTNAPKDNEVDEKTVAWLITYTERDGSKRQAVYTHNAIADWRMFDPAATSEPLTYAATVAELRAEVEMLRDALDSCREAGNKHVRRRCQMDDEIDRLTAEKTAAERRVEELEAAAKGAMALAWTDTREVEFDPTVILSPDQYDFSGWDCMRMEIHTPSGAWAVWPSGGKFSLYGGPNGLMCFERFSTREEAEERAYREIDRYCPTYPTAIVRKAITGADPT